MMIDMIPPDLNTLKYQKALIAEAPASKVVKVSPLSHYDLVRNPSYRKEGESLISKGKVGCIMLAGGQGTRLGFSGPKGMFPISDGDGKTLFHLFADQVADAQTASGKILHVAVMTSPENHTQTVEYFESHHFFGLSPDHFDFFTQTTLPILDANGDLVTGLDGEILRGPDGNGSVFSSFIASGLKEKWANERIEIVNIVPVDNPLADPFDPELVGYLETQGYNLAVKAIFREDPLESVGVLVEKEGRIQVVEYTELPQEEKTSKTAEGNLTHPCANITLFAMKLSQIQDYELPLHLAHKAIPMQCDPSPLKPNAWKFEKFIFDIFPLIERIGVLVYPRGECFAPLKNLHGIDSVETVQRALKERKK